LSWIVFQDDGQSLEIGTRIRFYMLSFNLILGNLNLLQFTFSDLRKQGQKYRKYL
jgi:hypothetical protein